MSCRFGWEMISKHQLIKEEIVHKMYPAEVLSRINEDTSLDEILANDFISYNLQEAFLPWPLSCFTPDTGLGNTNCSEHHRFIPCENFL